MTDLFTGIHLINGTEPLNCSKSIVVDTIPTEVKLLLYAVSTGSVLYCTIFLVRDWAQNSGGITKLMTILHSIVMVTLLSLQFIECVICFSYLTEILQILSRLEFCSGFMMLFMAFYLPMSEKEVHMLHNNLHRYPTIRVAYRYKYPLLLIGLLTMPEKYMLLLLALCNAFTIIMAIHFNPEKMTKLEVVALFFFKIRLSIFYFLKVAYNDNPYLSGAQPIVNLLKSAEMTRGIIFFLVFQHSRIPTPSKTQNDDETNDDVETISINENYSITHIRAEERCKGSISLGLHFRKVKSKLDNLSPDGRIKKKIMREGTGDVVPEKALVTIKYSGYFEDQDKPYNSTDARRTTGRYTLGGTELLYGLDVGIQSMRKGEIAIFWIDYTFAYGEMGCPPLIPPRGDVMFMVQLIDYLDSGTVNNFENLTVQEKKSYANVKLQVNSLFKIAADNFKRKKYDQVVRDYKRIIHDLEDAQFDNEEQEKKAQKLLSKSRLNLAICYNIQDIPRLACIECNAATHKTAKIYYNHGKALIKMGEYSEALTQLNKSLNMEPDNRAAVISEIIKAIELQQKYMRIQKDLWSNCLDQKKGEEEKDKQRDKLAREFVETFVNDNAVQRQEIPAGIDASLLELIRKHAALSSINIASISRFDKETHYLQKPEYV